MSEGLLSRQERYEVTVELKVPVIGLKMSRRVKVWRGTKLDLFLADLEKLLQEYSPDLRPKPISPKSDDES